MMKRTAAAVMAILTLTVLISCGESPAPAQVSPAQAADAAENVTKPETETEPEFIDSLPDDLDFGGTEINIAGYDQSQECAVAGKSIQSDMLCVCGYILSDCKQ